ncbi:helix-turn-helix transcriptional regulator [Aureisphaera galaxeae]|uniref:helix-turn-helix domain-containing protein n=1 Tax=Aureisphaera galaxeae TaxID=1538023 RepID=UPI0023500124|nr:helix-turn-helix transcriptional regulator [Aureisphaera galaxeae]MDC8004207.1 helix-turn-helix transcriptional regulator [Aureisphaera galaxeae]
MNDLLFFDYNQKSATLLIFFFHAIVFSSLLFNKGINEQKKHSKWLAVFIFLGALYICPFMLGYAGWYSVKSYREFMFFMPFQQLFLIGPVFFFYIKTLLNSDFKLSRKDYIHFLPAVAYMIYSIIVFVGDKLVLDEFYFYADGRDKDLDFWYQMAGLISMLFYLYKSLQYYLSYRKLSLQEVSYADEIAFRWIQHFTIAFGLILVLRVLFFILNPEWGEFGSKYWYYLCFSILLLYISITGYSHTIRVTRGLNVHDLVDLQPIRNDVKKDANNQTNDSLDLKEWKGKITLLFEADDIHKNPNLTLSDVANLLNTNRNIISKAINQEFDMNFNDFVNKKRAEAVIKMLQEGAHTSNTLLGIALDCGFNSKTTFNRAFKKHTTLTPKQYISKNRL